MKKWLLVLLVKFTTSTCLSRKQDNKLWLKQRLHSVSTDQMQVIAKAMVTYHEKHKKFPHKPSDLKGFINIPPYDNGRIAYQIFLSPSDTTTFEDHYTKGWDFADKNTSYVFHYNADIYDIDAVLLSEKKSYLWENAKTYVFVGGHAISGTDATLKKYLKNGKL